MRTPADTSSAGPVVEFAIITRPTAYRSPPTAVTRAAPYRSAIMPVNGCARPHTRFWSAIAAENVSRPQPSAEHIGCRKRPKPCRVPSASIRMRPAAPRTMSADRGRAIGQLVSRRYASAALSGSFRTSSISVQLAAPYMCGR